MCRYKKKNGMWVVDPKWYYMGCCRNLKNIFVDGGVKRKLNNMGAGVNKKCLPRGGVVGGGILISGTALTYFYVLEYFWTFKVTHMLWQANSTPQPLYTGFTLPVAIVTKWEAKIFLAQKNTIWRKTKSAKKSASSYHWFGLFYAT